LITSGQVDTAVQVAKVLRDTADMDVSAQTIRRGLKKVGLKAGAKSKKPLLSARHKRARLDFAVAHCYWTVEDWKQVIWSDETKINRLGSDGKKWVWKKAGEGPTDRTVDPTVKAT